MSKRKKKKSSSHAKPILSARFKPVASVQAKPVATVQAESVATVQAEPVATVQAESVATVQAESVATAQAEPIATAQAEPVATAQAKPIATVQAESVATAQAEPIATAQAEPVATVQAESVATVQAEPIATAQAEPVATVQAESVATAQAESVATAQAESVATAQAESVATAQAESVATVQAKPIASVQAKPVANVQAEPIVSAQAVTIADPFDCPDVSVVIPMYNSEKYIGECLESLLAQNFKNFEVIVVDDCSTDNSPVIVDSYIPKFNGRLTHFRLKKNTGGAGIPRNTGITIARGEYIYFMDSDDRVVENALKDDFKLAKEYDADVLYHTLFYNLSADGKTSKLAIVPKYKPEDEIVLDEDLLTRVKDIAQNKYYYAPWRSFNRRKFLVENELYFPNIRPYEDIVWNHALLIYAKRFLIVPTATYFYRDNENSMLRTEKTASQNAKFYLNPIIFGLKSLDTFLSRHEFFDDKPQLYYALLENYSNGRFTSLFKDSSNLEPFVLYETLKEEFGKSLGEYDVLIPALCTALAQEQKVTATKLQQFKEYVVRSKEKIAMLENEINSRKGKEY